MKASTPPDAQPQLTERQQLFKRFIEKNPNPPSNESIIELGNKLQRISVIEHSHSAFEQTFSGDQKTSEGSTPERKSRTNSNFSELTTSTNEKDNIVENLPIKEAKTAHNVRGEISTYEGEMMGRFNFERNGTDLIVASDSKIKRPSKVTGFLGDTAGDHVVPLAVFVSNITDEIKGKKVEEAIEYIAQHVIDPLGKSNENFQSFRIKANLHLEELTTRAKNYQDNQDSAPALLALIETQDKAAKFLKSELIPGITATWNQNIGTAFYGNKTQKELGIEGNQIKELLKQKGEQSYKDAAKLFAQGIDYQVKPGKESVSSNQAYVDYLQGIRNNHYGPLSNVLGDVAEYYVTQYHRDSDPKQNITRAEEFLDAFFDKSNKNAKNEEWINSLGTSTHFCKNNPQYENQTLDKKGLILLLIEDFKKDKPHIFTISQEHNNEQTPTLPLIRSRSQTSEDNSKMSIGSHKIANRTSLPAITDSSLRNALTAQAESGSNKRPKSPSVLGNDSIINNVLQPHPPSSPSSEPSSNKIRRIISAQNMR